jgi:hypothetical protein
MNIIRSLLFLLALVASTASAHKDRILSIRPDGSVPEIPASFGRVFLNISGLGGSKPTVQFRSGKKVNVLPSCVTRYINSSKVSDILVTGSWYHEQSTLPYYINVEFNEPGYISSRPFNSSFNILFNLRTTDIIEIKRFVADRSGNGGRYLTVNLPASCKFSRHAA